MQEIRALLTQASYLFVGVPASGLKRFFELIYHLDSLSLVHYCIGVHTQGFPRPGQALSTPLVLASQPHGLDDVSYS